MYFMCVFRVALSVRKSFERGELGTTPSKKLANLGLRVSNWIGKIILTSVNLNPLLVLSSTMD